MLLMLISGGRAEVGERNIRRAAGIGRQEIGRFPDSSAGSCHIDRVAGGVGRIHCNCTDLASGTSDCRRAHRRPLLAG